MNFIKQRPVVFWGTITTLASAVIGLLVVFGAWTPTAEQLAQVMVVIAAIGQIFVFVIQGQVTPVNNPNDGGSPLVPTAADSYEDVEEG